MYIKIESISEHTEALAEIGQTAAKAVTAIAGAVTAVATYATKFLNDFTQAIDKYIAEINELANNYNACGDTLRIFTEKQEQSGVSYDELQQKLANDENGAKEVFNQVITALSSVEDPIAQNTAYVALFGSMWEDMGATHLYYPLKILKGQ